MKKLAMLMPKYSLAELMAHDEWYQMHKLLLVGGALALSCVFCEYQAFDLFSIFVAA